MLVYHFVFSACLSSLTAKFTALSVLFIFQRWSPLSAVESHPGAQNTKARRRLITFRVRIFWEGLIETSVNGIHCEQSLFSSLMNMCMCLLFIASISSGEWNSSSFYSSSYHQHLAGFPSLMFSCAWVLFSLNHGLSFCSKFVPTYVIRSFFVAWTLYYQGVFPDTCCCGPVHVRLGYVCVGCLRVQEKGHAVEGRWMSKVQSPADINNLQKSLKYYNSSKDIQRKINCKFFKRNWHSLQSVSCEYSSS